jgi:hypothetical protein
MSHDYEQAEPNRMEPALKPRDTSREEKAVFPPEQTQLTVVMILIGSATFNLYSLTKDLFTDSPQSTTPQQICQE